MNFSDAYKTIPNQNGANRAASTAAFGNQQQPHHQQQTHVPAMGAQHRASQHGGVNGDQVHASRLYDPVSAAPGPGRQQQYYSYGPNHMQQHQNAVYNPYQYQAQPQQQNAVYSHPLGGSSYQQPYQHQFGQQQYQQQYQQQGSQYPGCGYVNPQAQTHAHASHGHYPAAPVAPQPPAPGQHARVLQSLSESYRQRAPNGAIASAPPKPQSKPVVVPSSPSPADEAQSLSFYCEACDKEFAARGQYDTHVATHEQCQHKDADTGAACSFRGTRKVVQAHFQSMHGLYSGSGFKDIVVEGQKFCVLLGTSVDDVAKWRAERKRKFPTADVVARREVAREEFVVAGGLPDSLDSATGGGAGTGAVAATVKSPRQPPLCSFFVHGKCTKLTEECRFAHDAERVAQLAPCNAYARRSHCRNGYKCRFLHVKGGAPAGGKDEAPKAKKAKRAEKGAIPPALDGLDGRGTLLGRLLRPQVESEASAVLQCFRFFVQSGFFVGEEGWDDEEKDEVGDEVGEEGEEEDGDEEEDDEEEDDDDEDEEGFASQEDGESSGESEAE